LAATGATSKVPPLMVTGLEKVWRPVILMVPAPVCVRGPEPEIGPLKVTEPGAVWDVDGRAAGEGDGPDGGGGAGVGDAESGAVGGLPDDQGRGAVGRKLAEPRARVPSLRLIVRPGANVTVPEMVTVARRVLFQRGGTTEQSAVRGGLEKFRRHGSDWRVVTDGGNGDGVHARLWWCRSSGTCRR